MASPVAARWRDYASLVKLSHSVFALPFALLSLLVAADGRPGARLSLLVIVAVVAARTAAMAYNRFADRELDRHNPRTAGREIPRGAVSPAAALALTGGASAVFLASCWLLAPIYFGLSIALLAIGIKFFQEVLHILPHVLELSESDLVLVVLSLVDIALVGGLLVMVMLSGYENFVSRIDIKEGAEKLDWLGKLDSGSLKQKVAASIVAISSIHLLKAFMNATQMPNDKLMWYVIIHMTFVISALGMAFVDRMNHH